jgi:hypothetical protein
LSKFHVHYSETRKPEDNLKRDAQIPEIWNDAKIILPENKKLVSPQEIANEMNDAPVDITGSYYSHMPSHYPYYYHPNLSIHTQHYYGHVPPHRYSHMEYYGASHHYGYHHQYDHMESNHVYAHRGTSHAQSSMFQNYYISRRPIYNSRYPALSPDIVRKLIYREWCSMEGSTL